MDLFQHRIIGIVLPPVVMIDQALELFLAINRMTAPRAAVVPPAATVKADTIRLRPKEKEQSGSGSRRQPPRPDSV